MAGLVWWIAAGAVAVLLVATGLTLLQDYHQTLTDAGRRLESQAALTVEHVDQVLRAADLGLRSVDDDLDTPEIVLARSYDRMHGLLRRIQVVSPALQGMAIVGADGRVVASASSPDPPPIDLSDRSFFRIHRDDPNAGFHVAPPLLARVFDVVAIPVSRRLSTSDGAFAGIVTARVDPAYFERFFRSVDADVVALFLNDGTLLARHPATDILKTPRVPPTDGLLKFSLDQRTGRFEGMSSDRKSTRLNSSHNPASRMPSSA
jgi:hypothetical protein